MAALVGVQMRPSFFQGTAISARQPMATRAAAAPLVVSARYRGEGTNLSKVGGFQRHGADTGSPEVQIARLSARVEQLTAHLQEHKKDYATRRGLMSILSQRKQMLLYLQRTNRESYERCLAELGIRQLKKEA